MSLRYPGVGGGGGGATPVDELPPIENAKPGDQFFLTTENTYYVVGEFTVDGIDYRPLRQDDFGLEANGGLIDYQGALSAAPTVGTANGRMYWFDVTAGQTTAPANQRVYRWKRHANSGVRQTNIRPSFSLVLMARLGKTARSTSSEATPEPSWRTTRPGRSDPTKPWWPSRPARP